jgi:hypothetical protein
MVERAAVCRFAVTAVAAFGSAWVALRRGSVAREIVDAVAAAEVVNASVAVGAAQAAQATQAAQVAETTPAKAPPGAASSAASAPRAFPA